jgi:hypothetical protein
MNLICHPPGDASAFNLEPAPASSMGFREQQVFLIEQPPGDFWELLVDDEPLDLVEAEHGRCWKWCPGFFAGEVTAQLLDGDGTPQQHYLLDVSPHEGKLGREVYLEMLQELWQADPSLVLGSEPGQTPRGELSHSDDPHLAFAKLRRFLPEFFTATQSVRNNPLQTLRSTREDLPAHRVRRADRHTMIAASRSPAALALVADNSDSDWAQNATFSVPRVEHVLDCPANRVLLSMTQALLRRVTSVLERLEDLVQKEQSETETPLAPRWPARREFLKRSRREILRLLRGKPLAEVSRSEVTAAGLNAVSAQPAYSKTYRSAWRALQNGFAGDPTDERLWVSPTWEIYERWCYVKLLSGIGEMFPGVDLKAIRSSSSDRAWAGDLPQGRIEVHLQAKFNQKPATEMGFRALSKRLIPDIVITIDGPDPVFIVLDAKYMCAQSTVVAAMTSAHLYHDALRWRGKRPDLSLLLTPSGGSTPWLEEREFWQTEGVGVLQFSGSTSSTNVLGRIFGSID